MVLTKLKTKKFGSLLWKSLIRLLYYCLHVQQSYSSRILGNKFGDQSQYSPASEVVAAKQNTINRNEMESYELNVLHVVLYICSILCKGFVCYVDNGHCTLVKIVIKLHLQFITIIALTYFPSHWQLPVIVIEMQVQLLWAKHSK